MEEKVFEISAKEVTVEVVDEGNRESIPPYPPH